MSHVPAGIALVYYSIGVTALGTILGLAVPHAFRGEPLLLYRVMLGLALISIGAGLLSLFGKILCLTAPADMPGALTVCVSLVCDVGAIAIAIASCTRQLPIAIAGLPLLLSIVSFVTFLLFLSHLGRFLEKDNLASDASGLLTLGICLLVASVIILMTRPWRSLNPLIMLIGLIVLILGIRGLFGYLKLLRDLIHVFANGSCGIAEVQLRRGGRCRTGTCSPSPPLLELSGLLLSTHHV